jgi:hypothetical protein
MRNTALGASPHAIEAKGEPHDADQVDLPPAKPVAERPADQQERGKRQRVAVHHPLQGGNAGVEIAPDGRQGDVDDRGV